MSERLAGLSPEKRALLARRLLDARRPTVFPLSSMQQRLWFLERLTPNNPAYLVPAAVRIRGELDGGVLRAVVNELVRRHEALRTTFELRDGTPVQIVAPRLSIEVPDDDLRGIASDARDAAIAARIAEVIATPFDLAAGPLLRLRLLRVRDDEHLLVVVVHHIVSDGWSIAVLVTEFAALYDAFAASRPSPLPELKIQYGDVAVWQQQHAHGPALAGDLAYWRQRLAGAPPVLELATDRPRPPIQTFHGSSWAFELPADVVHDLGAVGQAQGATTFMVLLAVFQMLLHRYSGQDDVVVGAPVANRDRAEVESVIGFFVNTLALRTDLSGSPSFAELVARVRETCLGAYAHQGVPFEKLVEELKPTRDLSRPPIFQVSFSYQPQPLPTIEVAGLELSRWPVRSIAARFDLELQFVDEGGGLGGLFEYNRDLFDEATIARFADHFRRLATAAAAHPELSIDELPMLADDERHDLLVRGTDTRRRWPDSDWAHHRIEHQARRSPDAEAVRFEDHALCYAELDRRANQLAHRLVRLGIAKDVLVGIAMERSLDMVVSILAIHKAGGAYLPLDPTYPAARLAYMLEDSHVPVVLTQLDVRDRIPASSASVLCVDQLADELDRELTSSPVIDVAGDDLAYVIYTSGSTGRPKGVQLPHCALANFLRAMEERPGIAARDVLLAVTSLSFDISILELLLPLVVGACVIVVPREVAGDAQLLTAALDHLRPTIMQATPSTWRMLVEAGWSGAPGLRMLCGGEAMTPGLASELRARGAELWNMYGPTETTIWSAVDRVGPGPIAIGEPIANTELHVLDRNRQLVPLGVPGELYIGGAGLARGYLGRPELTAERFVPHPSPVGLGNRLYRTGDLVRRRADGSIEFFGRIDHQVKVRGFRIEPGEIEQVLASHPQISAAIVAARDVAGDTRLVAYAVSDAEPAASALAAFARERLPEYMVPAAFVVLPAFPLTPNGKIDRAALPEPDLGRPALETPYQAPRDALERAIAEVWSQLLGVAQVGVDDNFFALGGHSLLATQVAIRTKPLAGVELPLRELFARPTVGGIAAWIRAHGAGGCDAISAPAARVVQPRPDPDAPAPLTFAQRRLWFLEQLSPGNRAYLLPATLRVRGPLDPAVLRRALVEVTRRHDALRTVFPEIDGRPQQVVRPEPAIALEVRDLQAMAPDRAADELRVRQQAMFETPFDLSAGPLLRFELLRIGGDETIVLLAMHHIVSDQWSLGVLLRELMTLGATFAAGGASPLPALEVQYPDFAAWQQDALTREAGQADLAFWTRQLRGAPAELGLPFGRPRPAEKTYRGAAIPVRIPAEITAELRAIARRENATLFMVLAAAFQVLLSRLSGTEDVVIGTPVANRRLTEVEPLIGLFVNTLVLRTDLSGNPSFRALLQRISKVCLDAYEHQDMPFERLVEELRPERSLARTPLFQVAFGLHNVPFPAWSAGALRVEPMPADAGTAKFDLELQMFEDGDVVDGRLEYSLDLFDAAAARRITTYFDHVLAAVAADPDQAIGALPLLDDRERGEVLALGNTDRREWPGAGWIHECFERCVREQPDAEALRFEGRSVSYAELDRRANQLAHRLRRLGVGRDVLVGVCMERSIEMVVSLFATLKAGGAYVPLDPGYPRSRLEMMLEDAQVPVLLAQRSVLDRLPRVSAEVLCVAELADELAGEPAGKPDVEIDGEDLAYVIFTSGSTGRPKGVMNVHAGIRNRLLWMQDAYRIGPTDRILQKTPFSFDVSVWEFFWPLMTGACLVVARPEGHRDGRYLVDTIQREQITTLHFVPSMLQVFLLE
ncbi:MAG TPA: amino acid adenylation domain-containing protein, partial [Kofleriaceae bacterium]|nr:amino acid adenylation domain-containing protein [Kofleriaceae bacterium]